MRYKLEALSGYLKAELLERETTAETAEFVHAIVDAVREKGVSRVLISHPIPGLRIAFVSDSREIAMSQDYIARLGRQQRSRGFIMTRKVCEALQAAGEILLVAG